MDERSGQRHGQNWPQVQTCETGKEADRRDVNRFRPASHEIAYVSKPIDRVNIESLRVVAEHLRRQEAPFKERGDWRGLGIGAMALVVEQAVEELEYLRQFEPSPNPSE